MIIFVVTFVIRETVTSTFNDDNVNDVDVVNDDNDDEKNVDLFSTDVNFSQFDNVND